MCAVADPESSSGQARAIREATNKSLMARDMYTEQVVFQLTGVLKSAQGQVHKALLGYKDVGSLPDNKLAAVNGLGKLDAQIQDAMRTLRRDQSLMFKTSSRAAFRSGIYRGIEEFASAKMSFYRDLTPDGIDKLTTSVFTLIDTDALDFMTNYNLVLVGDVGRELESGIKRTILSAITTGKGVRDIVRDMGAVIENKESFRNAGAKVFSKAQYRMEMIARTEILRAHNQGRIKFHQQVGVQRLEWMTMEDERMCPVCGALDGKVFDTDHFPSQPRHCNCRCSSVVAWPLVICGGELGATAANDKPACILPPQAIHEQAKQKVEEEQKLKTAFESGQIADLNTLTVKQLQALAKQNGIAVARTKSDFIKLLDAAEPGVGHADLSGAALQAKIKQYNIAALRSKDELATLLVQKQAAIQQAKALEEAAKNAAPKSDLSGLTMVQLKDMAKQHGVSLNLTKPEVIDMLDALEPGVDHSGLVGKALIAAKQKHGILPLKNKEQLAKALEKAAGQQIAEQAKQQALDAAKQEALKKAEQALKDAAEQIVMPPSASQYSSFLDSVKAAESELAKDSGLPASVLEQHAKSDDPDTREMAETYIAWVDRVQQAAIQGKSIPERFEGYLKKIVTKAKKTDSDFTVRKTKVLLEKRSISKGDLSVKSDAADLGDVFGGRHMPDGEQYEIDFGDGVRAVYRPWSSKNLYAHSGEFEMVVPNRPDAKSLDRALERMEKIGLKANVATPEDAEILYLLCAAPHNKYYVLPVIMCSWDLDVVSPERDPPNAAAHNMVGSA